MGADEVRPASQARTHAMHSAGTWGRRHNEQALVGSGKEPRLHKCGQRRVARRTIQPPQPLGLRRGQLEAGHLHVLRANSLQQTRDAQVGTAWLPGSLIDRRGLRQGDRLRIMQDGGEATLPFGRDDRLPGDCVRLPSGCRETAGLGAMFGVVTLERTAAPQRATA